MSLPDNTTNSVTGVPVGGEKATARFPLVCYDTMHSPANVADVDRTSYIQVGNGLQSQALSISRMIYLGDSAICVSDNSVDSVAFSLGFIWKLRAWLL